MRGGATAQPQKYDQDYVIADEDFQEPEQENSQDFEQPAPAKKLDSIEKTKNFERAYGKLIEKFYHEEGAALLIPRRT
jgi:hypothetical protein